MMSKISKTLIPVGLSLLVVSSDAFAPQAFTTRQATTLMAKKKGFGKSTAAAAPKKKQSPATEVEEPASSSTPILEVSSPLNKSAGADALSRLRQQKVEARNEELRSIRDLRSVDQQLVDSPDSAVIPERVAQRMGKRMLPFVGVPLFGVMGAFITFWYLATYKNYEFQPALVAFSTIGILGAGLLGITYSVMSASWDEDGDGSALGVDEFKKNLGSIKDGLKRTRENAILREKMSSLPDQEIEQAISNLNKKDQADKMKKLSAKEKFEKELE
eukprot:707737_1